MICFDEIGKLFSSAKTAGDNVVISCADGGEVVVVLVDGIPLAMEKVGDEVTWLLADIKVDVIGGVFPTYIWLFSVVLVAAVESTVAGDGIDCCAKTPSSPPPQILVVILVLRRGRTSRRTPRDTWTTRRPFYTVPF